MPLENLDDLQAAWNFFLVEKNDKGKLTQNGAWRRDNPGEWDKLKLYYEEKAGRPNLASITGKQMVEVVDAIIEARGQVVTPPVPPSPGIDAPVGPFTTKSGNALVQDGTAVTGGTLEKLHVTSAPGWGPGVMKWPPQESTGRFTVRDCIAENISMVGYPGTSGAAYWIGQTCDAYRLVGKNAAWMGMFTGSRCMDSNIHDFELINMPKIGVYPEHCTVNSKFYDFNIECEENGFNFEWAYGPKDGVIPEHAAYTTKLLGAAIGKGRAGSWGNKVYNGRIRTRSGYCVYVDAGGFANEFGVDGYLDLNGPYGIILPRQMMDPSRPNIVKSENINWNSIPSDRRIMYHDNPMGAL